MQTGRQTDRKRLEQINVLLYWWCSIAQAWESSSIGGARTLWMPSSRRLFPLFLFFFLVFLGVGSWVGWGGAFWQTAPAMEKENRTGTIGEWPRYHLRKRELRFSSISCPFIKDICAGNIEVISPSSSLMAGGPTSNWNRLWKSEMAKPAAAIL